MELRLDPKLEEKLSRLAAEQGRDRESLVVEAVERLVNNEEWFVQEVEKGIAAAERGELIEHKDIQKRIDHRCPVNAHSLDRTRGQRSHKHL